MSELAGKVAIVTGGGRGIGRATALELAQRGADVAVAARSRAELEAVADEIKRLGRRAAALPADLSTSEAAQRLVEEANDALGPVAILINNAGLAGPFGPLWEVDPAEWERALRVNLLAPFWLIHAAVPQMLQSGWGRVINFSSGAARSPLERAGAYSTTKAALDMLTRQLGVEVAGTGVASIGVYPGVVDTAMQTEIREQPPERVGSAVAWRFHQYRASGQLQAPERPARLIAALASGSGAEFNGQIVDIYSDAGQRLIGG